MYQNIIIYWVGVSPTLKTGTESYFSLHLQCLGGRLGHCFRGRTEYIPHIFYSLLASALKKTQSLGLSKSHTSLGTVQLSKKLRATSFQRHPAPRLLDWTSGERGWGKGRKEDPGFPRCLSLWVMFFHSLRGFVFDLKKQKSFQGKLIFVMVQNHLICDIISSAELSTF